MSILHNSLVFYAQILHIIYKMMRLPGLFQQPGPFSATTLSSFSELRMCAESRHLGSGMSQPGDHQPGHGKVDKSHATRMGALKIAGKPTAMGDPGVRAFHYPSPGKDVEPFPT